jgi:hypothetical protein
MLRTILTGEDLPHSGTLHCVASYKFTDDVWHMQCFNFRLHLDPDDRGSKFHRKVRKFLPDYTASHSTVAALIITEQDAWAELKGTRL